MQHPLSDSLEGKVYLSDLSQKDKPWDARRKDSDKVGELYREAGYDRYHERMAECSQRLEFLVKPDTEGKNHFKLQAARFCRVRFCPTCQWRKELMWRARFFKNVPRIQADYPTARYVFLTLTVKNCPLEDLRSTIKAMNKGWNRLAQRKAFPALGFVRSLEVTKGEDGSAHPHFHVMMMVPPAYFGRGYIKQAEWTAMWRDAMRLDYDPIVNIKTVKSFKKVKDNDLAQVSGGICETLKYSVKPSDLVQDSAWLDGLTQQMHKVRTVSLGGLFKQYLSEEEPEDLIHTDLPEDDEGVEFTDISLSLFAEWDKYVSRYRISKIE